MKYLKSSFTTIDNLLDLVINTKAFRRNAIALFSLLYYTEVVVLLHRHY